MLYFGGMYKSDVLAYYNDNGAAAGRAIGLTKAAVSSWGKLVPLDKALRFQAVTKGKLKVNQSLYWTPEESARA